MVRGGLGMRLAKRYLERSSVAVKKLYGRYGGT